MKLYLDYLDLGGTLGGWGDSFKESNFKNETPTQDPPKHKAGRQQQNPPHCHLAAGVCWLTRKVLWLLKVKGEASEWAALEMRWADRQAPADRLLQSFSLGPAHGCFWPQEALPCAAWSREESSSLEVLVLLLSPSSCFSQPWVFIVVQRWGSQATPRPRPIWATW